MHVCWGNFEGPHDHDIPLERVIDLILRARPATILFEAANPRHEHEWKVWANTKIPEEKLLAPGLIDTCSNYVEHPELIAQRIERYTAIVGAERVIASTDCGFGTFAGYGKIDPAVTWKKLRALRAGADPRSGPIVAHGEPPHRSAPGGRARSARLAASRPAPGRASRAWRRSRQRAELRRPISIRRG